MLYIDILEVEEGDIFLSMVKKRILDLVQNKQ